MQLHKINILDCFIFRYQTNFSEWDFVIKYFNTESPHRNNMPGKSNNEKRKEAGPKKTKAQENAGKSASQKKEEQKAHKAAKQAKKNERWYICSNAAF